MQNNGRFLTLGMIVGLILGAAMGTVLARWGMVCESFFDIKLSHVLNFLLTAAIGIVVSLMIKNRMELRSRRRDIIGGYLDNIRTQAFELWELAQKNAAHPDPELESKVVGALKILGMAVEEAIQLTTKEGVKKQERGKQPLAKAFFDFKKSISDTPFGQNKPYPAESLVTMADRYSKLLLAIQRLKLSMVS